MNLDDSDDFNCCICFDVFGEGPRCPRVLSCGHTYCHACLEKLLVRPKPFCPTCKVEIWNQRVELIPVNYIIKSYLAVKERDTGGGNSSQAVAQNDEANEYQSVQRILKFSKTSAQREIKYLSEGYCEEHESFKFLRCMTCSLWVCGVCVALSHKQCRTLLVKEAVTEMKDGISQKVRLERDFQKSETSTADRLIKSFEDGCKEMKRSREKLQHELKKEIEKSMTVEKYLEKPVSWKREQSICCDKLESWNTLGLTSSNYRLERDFQKSETSTADRLIKSFEDGCKEMKRSWEKLQQELKKEIEKSMTVEKYLEKPVSWKREQNICCDKLESWNTLGLTSSNYRLERDFQKSETSTFDRLIKSFEDGCKEMKRSWEKLQQDLKKEIEKSMTVEKYLEKPVSWKREQNTCCDKLESWNTLGLTSSNCTDFTEVTNSVDNCFQEIKKNNLMFQIQNEVVPNLNSDDIKLLCEEEEVYFCHQHGRRMYFGKVEISDGSVWVHSFCTRIPDISATLVPFHQLRRQFGGLTTLPQKVFLKMSCEYSDYGDVVIATDGLCSRTKNFLLRCEGINRCSYKGCQLLYTRDPTQELFRINILLKARKIVGVCDVPNRAFVYGFAAETNETVSDFSICIEDAASAPLLGKFGEVKSGMDVMQKVLKDFAAGKKVIIKDCGIIL